MSSHPNPTSLDTVRGSAGCSRHREVAARAVCPCSGSLLAIAVCRIPGSSWQPHPLQCCELGRGRRMSASGRKPDYSPAFSSLHPSVVSPTPSQHPPRRAQTPPPLTGTPRGYDAKSSAPFPSTVAPARSFSRYRAPGSRHNNPDEAARRVHFRASVDVQGQHSDPAMTSSAMGISRQIPNPHQRQPAIGTITPTSFPDSTHRCYTPHHANSAYTTQFPEPTSCFCHRPNRSQSQPSHNHVAKQQVVNQ